MCGIAGWFGPPPEAPQQRLVAMLDRIVHRGPDDSGTLIDGPAALGMRRLSIIDLATGHQPIANEDGSVSIVFNGEIYNFRELRRDLEACGHTFRTHADTEVIVHAYEQWGDDCVARLNGIFAFAIWDRPRQRVFLARDHFGVKPLYWSWRDGRLLFASEIKALAPWGVPTEVDLEGLDLALAFGYVPSPFTLFRGVNKLAAGHALSLAVGGEPVVRRYFQPKPTLLAGSEDDIVTGLRERLERAVERQMMSDVPIGALLSGGVDSTAIATLMRRFSDDISTFSIGIRDAPAIDELATARATAQRLGTRHHELQIDARDYVEFLPTAHAFLEEPSTPSALLTYFVCKLAREHVKVVLTGQGADELFAGYTRYLGERYGGFYRRIPTAITDRLPALAHRLHAPMTIRRAVDSLAEPDPTRRFRKIVEVFGDAERAQLLGTRATYDPIAAWSDGLAALSPLKQLLYIEARTTLGDNLLGFGDKMSMATSVEARVPFLDLELAAYAESIPDALLVRGRQKKYILRRALRGLVPDQVLDGKKLGWAIPDAAWFRGPLDVYLTELLGSGARITRYIPAQRIAEMLAEHRSGARNRWRHLFTLLSIELCLQAMLTR